MDQTTVVIATHAAERWSLLEDAVESVRSQAGDVPIVLAVDHDERLASSVRDRWPQIPVVLNQGTRGASSTRNLGVEQVRTPFVVFMDDDARARPGWLAALVAPLGQDDVVGTGGRIAPLWAHQRGRPAWFPEEFDWAVGGSFRGMPTESAVVRNVWSGNMAVRRTVFEAVGGFRVGFGKIGNRSRPEDTDLCIRMAAAVQGGHWLYEPQALIDHHVPISRSTYRFFLARSFHEGWGKVEMSRLLGPAERLGHERGYLTRTVPKGLATAVTDAAQGRRAGVLRAGALATGVAAAGAGAVCAATNGAVTALRERRSV